MALDPCVSAVLRTLSVVTLEALRQAIQAQKGFADARIPKLNLQRLNCGVALAYLDAAETLIDASLSPVLNALTFYPTAITNATGVMQCAQIGELLNAPTQIVGALKTTLDNTTFEARRYAGIQQEIIDETDRLSQLSTLLDETIDLIDNLIIEKYLPPAP